MKKTLTIALSLCILCALAEVLYRFGFYQADLEEHSHNLHNLPQRVVEQQAQVVYLGESSNHTYSPGDQDTAWISEMISRQFPSLRMTDMTHDGSHADIYLQLLRNLGRNSSVETIIVTMNLRTFSPNWMFSPQETPLQKKLVLMRSRPAIVNRFMLSFKGYDIKTDNERYEQMRHYWEAHPLPKHPDISAWIDSLPDTAADMLVKCYYFKIDTNDNRRIRNFDQIMQLAKRRGWNVIFNILSEDVGWCERAVGKDLVEQMRANRDLLAERYTRQGAQVVDNLEVVPSELFRDRDWPTEHYAAAGRQAVADNVAAALQNLYPQQERIR